MVTSRSAKYPQKIEMLGVSPLVQGRASILRNERPIILKKLRISPGGDFYKKKQNVQIADLGRAVPMVGRIGSIVKLSRAGRTDPTGWFRYRTMRNVPVLGVGAASRRATAIRSNSSFFGNNNRIVRIKKFSEFENQKSIIVAKTGKVPLSI